MSTSGELPAELEAGALALVAGEKNLVANLANLAAHFFHSIAGLNWAGFYLWDETDGELVLGPFQGKPACLRIRPQRGVCGHAFSTREVQRVADVQAFPGHIACDSASRSELVIPLLLGDRCVGVLDLDAPTENHFSPELAERLRMLMSQLVPQLWT